MKKGFARSVIVRKKCVFVRFWDGRRYSVGDFSGTITIDRSNLLGISVHISPGLPGGRKQG